MRRNFILFAALDILSMAAFFHIAIYCPQIASSEIIKPNCKSTNILQVYPHHVIPFQSCAPVELMRDTLYCEATFISDNAKNMCCADGVITESSLHIASVVSLVLGGLTALVIIMLMASLMPLYIKITDVEDQRNQWEGVKLMKSDFGSRVSTKVRDFLKRDPTDSILSVNGLFLYRNLRPKARLNIYLLKEAFEELERHPFKDDDFYDFASEFLLDTVHRAAFMKIPNDRKADWLVKRYLTDLLIGDEEEYYDEKNLINGRS